MRIPLLSENIGELATAVAVTSGSWNDGGTWQGGVIPDAGAIVHIPLGVEVTVDETVQDSPFYVHYDGTIRFDSSAGDVSFEVDTLFGTMTSSFEVDASSGNLVDVVFSPFADLAQHGLVDGDVVKDGVTYDDNEGVLGRFTWDPDQLTLGLVSMGSVSIEGEETAGHLSLHETAYLDDTSATFSLTSLQLDGTETDAEILEQIGWNSGDQIALGSTEYFDYASSESGEPQDEIVQIRSVAIEDGSLVVTFEQPLSHTHSVKHIDADQDGTLDTVIAGHGANLSRTVQFRSDAATQTNENGIVIDESRGVSVSDNLGLSDVSAYGSK